MNLPKQIRKNTPNSPQIQPKHGKTCISVRDQARYKPLIFQAFCQQEGVPEQLRAIDVKVEAVFGGAELDAFGLPGRLQTQGCGEQGFCAKAHVAGLQNGEGVGQSHRLYSRSRPAKPPRQVFTGLSSSMRNA